MFIKMEPLAANGRCWRRRSPTALVHSAFGAGVQGLHCTASELTEEDWAFYEQCVQVCSTLWAVSCSLLFPRR